MSSGTETVLIAHPYSGVMSGTSMKIYTRNPKQLDIVKKELSAKTDRKSLYGEIRDEIETINDKIRLMQSYIKAYNNYKDLVKEFYDQFELYEAPTINNEKAELYSNLNPAIMHWYEDAYYVYDKETQTLYIM